MLLLIFISKQLAEKTNGETGLLGCSWQMTIKMMVDINIQQ